MTLPIFPARMRASAALVLALGLAAAALTVSVDASAGLRDRHWGGARQAWRAGQPPRAGQPAHRARIAPFRAHHHGAASNAAPGVRPHSAAHRPSHQAHAAGQRNNPAGRQHAAGQRNNQHHVRPSAARQRSAAFSHSAAQRRPFAAPLAARPNVRSVFRAGPLPGESGFTGVPPRGETRFRPGEMVLQVGSDVPAQRVEGIARRMGLSMVSSQTYSLAGRTLYRLRIDNGRPVDQVIRAIEAEDKSLVATPNYVYSLQQDKRTAARAMPAALNQYSVVKLRLGEAHRGATGRGIVIAVIDSEIDAQHPDLIGSVVDRYDLMGTPDKPDAHGTGMAGAIAAHRTLTGVAPGARILAIHAFGGKNNAYQATTDRLLLGIDWAISKGARIINMSFAGPRDPLLQLAIKKAREKGVVLIAAAGNAGQDSPPLYPAADPDVIAVTAVDENDNVLAKANRGGHIAVAAPGVDVPAPAPNGRYQLSTGTSIAAAQVSGVAALMLERRPDATPDMITDTLLASATDLGPKGHDNHYGWGLVDPRRALDWLDAKDKSVRAAQ